MTYDETTRWTLFVDETGQFDDVSKRVFLAAVAVNTRVDPMLRVRLREALRRVAPMIPWPIHRWLATKAVMYPLWYEMSDVPPDSDALQRAVTTALEVFERDASEALERTRRTLEQGAEPEGEWLRELRRALRRAEPDASELLERKMEAVCGSLGYAFKTAVGEQLEDSSVQAFVVSESENGDASLDGSSQRYIQLLTCLLERLNDSFSRLDGVHQVSVNLADRRAGHPDLPDSARSSERGVMHLNRSHITAASSHIERAPEEAEKDVVSVRFSPGQIWPYDEDVDPGIVMADSVANHLYRWAVELGNDTRFEQLGHLQGVVEAYFSMSMSSGSPELPHASASGAARESVNRARIRARETEHLDASEVEQLWIAEQANQWIAHFDGGEGSL